MSRFQRKSQGNKKIGKHDLYHTKKEINRTSLWGCLDIGNIKQKLEIANFSMSRDFPDVPMAGTLPPNAGAQVQF